MKLPLSIACLVLAVLVASWFAQDVRTNRAASTSPVSGATVEVLAIDGIDLAVVQHLIASYPARMTNFAQLLR